MAAARRTVVVLGGYGAFGLRIARRLAVDPTIRIVLAGRSGDVARTAAAELVRSEQTRAEVSGAAIDTNASDGLANALEREHATVVINTVGPFHPNSDYAVARACLSAGAHYIDLADNRRFVCDFGAALDASARARGLYAIAGASTVPTVTSAFVARAVALANLARVDTISTALSPGNRTPKGDATIASVLGYCGVPFDTLEDGRVRSVRGWTELRRLRFLGAANERWVARCDVPDLELLRAAYPTARTVAFFAGLELKVFSLGIRAMAAMRAIGLVRDWVPWARALGRSARWLDSFGTEDGGVLVYVSGVTAAGEPRAATIQLHGSRGDGPQVPVTPSVVLARELLARGRLASCAPGARAAFGLISAAELETVAAADGLDWHIAQNALGCWHAGAGVAGRESQTDARDARVPFARALGESAMARMPRAMARFHTEGGRVRGALAVRGASNWLGRMVAAMLGLPRAGAGERLDVTVTATRDGTWTRTFTDAQTQRAWTMATQWSAEPRSSSLVFETLGPVRVGFHLFPLDGGASGFEHRTKALWFAGVRLPLWVAARAADGVSRAHANGRGWAVDVSVRVPLIGQLVAYHGDVIVDAPPVESSIPARP